MSDDYEFLENQLLDELSNSISDFLHKAQFIDKARAVDDSIDSLISCMIGVLSFTFEHDQDLIEGAKMVNERLSKATELEVNNRSANRECYLNGPK